MNFIHNPENISNFDIIVIGSGLSGSVIAREFATHKNKKVLVIEQRNHIGGNCYDFINEYGFYECKYGAHIFHTKNERVWEYVQQFSEWKTYYHSVISYVNNKYIPVPINIQSINLLFDINIQDSMEMDAWLDNNRVKNIDIKNGKDLILSKCGYQCYEWLFKYYTKKQWDKYPEELDSSILNRIPIRNNFNSFYFSDKYQALPTYGYTHFIQNILTHSNIYVLLNYSFVSKNYILRKNQILIYTGAIDNYFYEFQLPKLEYRSLIFERENIKDVVYFQQNSVINYPEKEYLYTRIVEPKHFYPNSKKGTIIIKEYSTDKGEPYYPVINDRNVKIYQKYKELALSLESKNIYFIGRLANFKYFNMDDAILNALHFFSTMFMCDHNNSE
jgi:UDP-galactopyranose mutase